MATPKEVLNIHVGKAGIEVGKPCWELFGAEQGISGDGHICRETGIEWTSFYRETEDGRYIPRAVFADLEPTYIDSLKCGQHKDLFVCDQLVSGKMDAASLYPRGYYTVGANHLDDVLQAIRRQMEHADSPQCILAYNSLGGGTGSGFSTLILEWITHDYPEVPIIEFSILPTPKVSPCILEPYNVCLATTNKLECTNIGCTFLLDNKRLYDICHNQLETDCPTYHDMNQVISHVISSVTAGMRYPNDHLRVLNDVTGFDLNPLPRVHFPVISYSPFISTERSYHAENDSFEGLFNAENKLLDCSSNLEKHISCCLCYRGQHIKPEDIGKSESFLGDLDFTDYGPTEAKITLHKQTLKYLKNDILGESKQSALLIDNCTAVKSVWRGVREEVDLLLSRRAYLHWFTAENMDADELDDSRECLASLEGYYEQIENEAPNKVRVGGVV